MAILVTSKYEEDPIKIEGARVATTQNIDFSNTQGQITQHTGTQLLIVIIDATWNVNACYYEVSYASARSLRMRRSTSSVLGR